MKKLCFAQRACHVRYFLGPLGLGTLHIATTREGLFEASFITLSWAGTQALDPRHQAVSHPSKHHEAPRLFIHLDPIL